MPTIQSLPRDANRRAVPIVPARQAFAVTVDSTISSSTEITLNASTTMIEVNALNQGIYLRWGTSDASNSNFDEFILPNSVRHYAVPYSTTTGTLFTAVNFIEATSAATLIVIEK